jgi:lipoprotein-anchoring transpeptidase ErfK/SrfK
MSLGKILAITATLLLIIMGVLALFKGEKNAEPLALKAVSKLIEVDLDIDNKPAAPVKIPLPAPVAVMPVVQPDSKKLPEADRIHELFNTSGAKLSLVETISYKSRVGWQKGRPAWLSDYASHYDTSRHFIARSLNGKPDYLKQDVKEGSKFNVLRQDIPIEFQLVIDTSLCKMWFYGINAATGEKILLKTYRVSLGRPSSDRASGLLTPLGKFLLGKRVAIYKPSVMGHHKGSKVEMITVFGTRWIPFEKEIGKTSAPAKGLGIHGVPWTKKGESQWTQDISSLSCYESDGCVRMSSEDIEEVFAIILTKPAYVELVRDYFLSDIHSP